MNPWETSIMVSTAPAELKVEQLRKHRHSGAPGIPHPDGCQLIIVEVTSRIHGLGGPARARISDGMNILVWLTDSRMAYS